MASNNQPRTEFNQALKAIASERGIDVNVIIDAIKQAIIAAFRRDQKESGVEYSEETVFDAQIDSLDGGAKVLVDGKRCNTSRVWKNCGSNGKTSNSSKNKRSRKRNCYGRIYR